MYMNVSQDGVLNQLKALTDYTSEKLQWEDISLLDAVDLVGWTHTEAKKLIPDQMELYRLIYASRFRRLFEQFVMPRELNLQINRHKPY